MVKPTRREAVEIAEQFAAILASGDAAVIAKATALLAVIVGRSDWEPSKPGFGFVAPAYRD